MIRSGWAPSSGVRGWTETGFPKGSGGQNGLVPEKCRQTRAGRLGGFRATRPHTQSRGGPRASAAARAAPPGKPDRPDPAAPHLSNPAGLESPAPGPATHVSSCAPPSCQPEAAGAAGSCSRRWERARFHDHGGAAWGPPSRFQARLRARVPSPLNLRLLRVVSPWMCG